MPKSNLIHILETGTIAGCNIHSSIYCAHWHYYPIPADLMIDYGWLKGTDEKRTNPDEWVKFHNREDKPATIWFHGHKMGSQYLLERKKYSFFS